MYTRCGDVFVAIVTCLLLVLT